MNKLPERFAIIWDGQTYSLTAQEDYVDGGGTERTRLTWESHCPGCGSAFFWATGKTFRSPNRRCDSCKSPGKPARVCSDRAARQSVPEEIFP
jgi:hypothetical protein